MLRRTLAAALIVFAAPQGTLLSPEAAHAAVAHLTATSVARVSVVLIAPLQLITIQRDNGATERAWFEARLTAGDATGGGTAQMDGAILVVSAADGPMPQVGRAARKLRIDIEQGSVDSNLVIRFEGTATLEDGDKTATFPIAGSVSPMEGNADCLIWDILGSNVSDRAVFESIGRLIAS